MISQLTIQNFGLIDRISLEFSSGLNIFTGETGAGKSILIDALRFALGERLNSSQIRYKDNATSVECVFQLPQAFISEYPVFAEYSSDDDSGTLIIHRSVSPENKNKIKLNGFTITVSQLKILGDHLIDFHGPNDHQMLLSSSSHIMILDRLCESNDLKQKYEKAYFEFCRIQKKKNEMIKLSENRARDMDLFSHQLKELEQVPLNNEKYEELQQEQIRMDNAEKFCESITILIDLLENSGYGISEKISEAFVPLEKLNAYDASTLEMHELLTGMQNNSDELLSVLRSYSEKLSFEPEQAQEIYRLNDIYFEIIRKYGPSIDDARNSYGEIKEKYELLVDIEHNTALIDGQIDKARSNALSLAKKITATRKKEAIKLKHTIESELKELGIKHIEFECRLEKSDLDKNGVDRVTFFISPNAGEELKPLSDIVSSGEAARLMLALKKALTNVDPIPVLIFDEIDAQIGGRLGTITGKKLRDLALPRQVLAITHLPQIASFGAEHFKVVKKVESGRTITKVLQLDDTARISELAEMMSGNNEDQISVEHAKKMLQEAGKA